MCSSDLRRWAWVDPLKDTQAAELAIKNGIRSRSDVASEAGKNFEDVIGELAREDQLLESYGVTVGDKKDTEKGGGDK